jgi:hypothetical protein
VNASDSSIPFLSVGFKKNIRENPKYFFPIPQVLPPQDKNAHKILGFTEPSVAAQRHGGGALRATPIAPP